MGCSAVIVHDANPDALSRRVDAARAVAGDIPVQAVASRTAVHLLARSAPDEAVVLVDLFATDQIALDRPGERLLRRLAHHPATAHVVGVAWSAQIADDVVHGARAAGARGFVGATLDRAREAAALEAVLRGDEVWPETVGAGDGDAEAWASWFDDRFGIPWEPWIEPILVRLASAVERGAVADELVEAGAARSAGHARSRMRMLGDVLAGEHRNSRPAVAAAASLALSQIAGHRVLAERPAAPVSLEHGARAIHTAPSLVRAAGLTPEEIDEVVAFEGLIRSKRVSDSGTAGAPPADRVRHERRWAAGRRAIEKGAGKDDVDHVINGLLAQLDDALGAIDDARQDELYHPEARAAAALSLLGTAGSADLDGVVMTAGEPTWRGLSVAELAIADSVPVEALRAFTSAVDAAVLRTSAVG